MQASQSIYACFMLTNSAQKTDVSTVDCFFDNHCTNDVFTFIKKPLLDLQDTLSPEWLLSTNMQMSTSLPQGSGAFTGIASWHPYRILTYHIP